MHVRDIILHAPVCNIRVILRNRKRVDGTQRLFRPKEFCFISRWPATFITRCAIVSLKRNRIRKSVDIHGGCGKRTAETYISPVEHSRN